MHECGVFGGLNFSGVRIDDSHKKSKAGGHMKETVDLKELAAGFEMKVGELAEFLGYSKQALCQMNDGTNGVCTGRYYAALKLLVFQSDKLYEDDLKRALERKQSREKMVRRMCNSVGAINVVK